MWSNQRVECWFGISKIQKCCGPNHVHLSLLSLCGDYLPLNTWTSILSPNSNISKRKAAFCKEAVCLLAKHWGQPPCNGSSGSPLDILHPHGSSLNLAVSQCSMAKVTMTTATFFSLGHSGERVLKSHRKTFHLTT